MKQRRPIQPLRHTFLKNNHSSIIKRIWISGQLWVHQVLPYHPGHQHRSAGFERHIGDHRRRCTYSTRRDKNKVIHSQISGSFATRPMRPRVLLQKGKTRKQQTHVQTFELKLTCRSSSSGRTVDLYFAFHVSISIPRDPCTGVSYIAAVPCVVRKRFDHLFRPRRHGDSLFPRDHKVSSLCTPVLVNFY